MKLHIYNIAGEYVRSIEDFTNIKPLKDGRCFIGETRRYLCPLCGEYHKQDYTTQIPKGYTLKIAL